MKSILLAMPVVLVLGLLATQQLIRNQAAVVAKLHGRGPECSWLGVLRMPSVENAMISHAVVVSTARDYYPQLGIELLEGPERSYWIKRSPEAAMPGRSLLAYLLSDHLYIASEYSKQMVHRGNIVVDVGAHVGVFTQVALRQGASKVIAVEPDPVNLECLRRNFAAEVQSGRVVPFSKGLWSSDGTLELNESSFNSGTNSVVPGFVKNASETTHITVTTFDRMVTELGLERVDFIKMDIEGAEREALKGAQDTLRQLHPRLMLDSYHRVDDLSAFRSIILSINPRYTYTCGPCEYRPEYDGVAPHVTFWSSKPD